MSYGMSYYVEQAMNDANRGWADVPSQFQPGVGGEFGGAYGHQYGALRQRNPFTMPGVGMGGSMTRPSREGRGTTAFSRGNLGRSITGMSPAALLQNQKLAGLGVDPGQPPGMNAVQQARMSGPPQHSYGANQADLAGYMTQPTRS